MCPLRALYGASKVDQEVVVCCIISALVVLAGLGLLPWPPAEDELVGIASHFADCDVDRDLVVTRREFRECWPYATRASADFLWADADGDRQLSLDEFVSAFAEDGAEE